VAVGPSSGGRPSQYGAIFVLFGILLAAPFVLASFWLSLGERGIDRAARQKALGQMLFVIGAGRWLGILVAIGPLFAEGSLLLMACGAAIAARAGRPAKNRADE